jgi:hypothetical protein
MIRRSVNLREEGYGEAGRSLLQQECEKNSRTGLYSFKLHQEGHRKEVQIRGY